MLIEYLLLRNLALVAADLEMNMKISCNMFCHLLAFPSLNIVYSNFLAFGDLCVFFLVFSKSSVYIKNTNNHMS